ncbi:Succinyl-CoA ligase [ADP-forming] subunit beta, mitochondrial [Orchesella cincta]|uniref:Succinyl-CoA ligase [ADP-forming] subunit beta, mitochondrial n=1 Tax=Orchesella cincta TaxID=48709 RepID=A0A1D2NHP3_ORCCI|nr:Succinyl-CoA ligase [ADP-forming] subunit beta, mitochondrial [Orchesella cincta]
MAHLFTRSALKTLTRTLCPNSVLQESRRFLNVHEYVSYTILRDNGIPVPKFGVANSGSEAGKIAKDLGTNDLVIKAQVLTGGRGKGHFKGGLKGGVKLVYSPEEAEKISGQMIGDYLVTKQTARRGGGSATKMITERKYPRKEYYFCIMMERSFGGPVIIASSQGGVNIEDVAAENPDAILKIPIDVVEGLSKEKAVSVAQKLGFGDKSDHISNMFLNVYKLFTSSDALMVELNPLAEDSNGDSWTRRSGLTTTQISVRRRYSATGLGSGGCEGGEAAKHNLNYIALDGDIGCLVNGAGLAMATMDIIKLHGGSPANFLDVGVALPLSKLKKLLKSSLQILKFMPSWIIAAAQELQLKIPIIARLQGTNVDDAKVLIASSGLKILACDNLDEAARLAVKLSNIVKLAKSAKVDINFEIPI